MPGSVNVVREKDSEEQAIRLRQNGKLIITGQAAISQAEVSVNVRPSPLTIEEPPAASFTIAFYTAQKKNMSE